MRSFLSSFKAGKTISFIALLAVAAFFINQCGVSTRFAKWGGPRFLLMGSMGTEMVPNEVKPEDALAEVPADTEAPMSLPVEKEELKKKPFRIASTTNNTLSSSPSIAETVATSKATTHDLQIGFDLSSGFIAPTLRYEWAFSPRSTLGAHLSYSKNVFSGPEAQLYGGGLSYSYYLTGRAFDGLSLDAIASTYDIMALTRFRRSHITPSAIAGLATLHGKIVDGLNYNAGAGIQYVHLWGQDNGDIEFRTWVPAFKVSLGYDF